MIVEPFNYWKGGWLQVEDVLFRNTDLLHHPKTKLENFLILTLKSKNE